MCFNMVFTAFVLILIREVMLEILNIVMKIKTVCPRLTLETINKSYNNKYIELVISKPTTKSVRV